MVRQAINVKYFYSFDYFNFQATKPKIGTDVGNRTQLYQFWYQIDVIMTSYDSDRTHYR